MEPSNYLQVSSSNGKEGEEASTWQTVGPITASNNDDCNTESNCQQEAPKRQYTKALPLHVKHLLAPHATIKSHRKSKYLYRHSHDKIDTNLLVFLHGAGDSHTIYHALGRKLSIPQCATLSLHASCMNDSNERDGRDKCGFEALPFGLGWSWFQEMDYNTGLPLNKTSSCYKSSLERAATQLDNLLDDLTSIGEEDDSSSGGWIPERIFLFGFSAGACLAMQTCAHRIQKTKRPLGGAMCIAGGARIVDNVTDNEDGIDATPVLLVVGEKDQKFQTSDAKEAASRYNNSIHNNGVKTSVAKIHIVKGKKEHVMMNTQEEVRAVMEFCGENMIRRTMAMEGYCEVHPGA
uniref:Phospholipase/carboxylesterase/thioesterase domain-containing protein n=1 Tax=Chaetoceros debilis TaxID=122233 RepID=A0A7S3QK42_9STRA|mmetsp:Transcript_9901/g.14911  ORF Transcript_9901/g.14911 Transcript_9901/m.14911 type:complete len:349 (-) Transcript_9901:109-1155(-)